MRNSLLSIQHISHHNDKCTLPLQKLPQRRLVDLIVEDRAHRDDFTIVSPLMNSAFSDSGTVSMKWARRLGVGQVMETLHHGRQAWRIEQLFQRWRVRLRVKLRDRHGFLSFLARL